MTTVRVAIATTAGPVAIERIAPVRLRKSKVFTWAGRSPLAMSESYDDFVRKRVARIPSFDRGGALRMDLSGEITAGDSWQLPVFLAHALHGAERLAARGENNDASVFLYATGRLDFEMAAGEIGYVEDKLRVLASDESLRVRAARGRRVIIALPEANAEDAHPEQEQLRALGAQIVPVGEVTELLRRQLDLTIRLSGPHPDDGWKGSPFRGLEVFDIEHRKIFWGRGKAREEAMQRLRQQEQHGCAFLLIHGSSGVGKSSLARAGLLADLKHTASANDRWRSAIIVPRQGNRPPLAALAAALVEAVPELDIPRAELPARIMANPSEMAELVAAALTRAAASGRVRVALLVDQLEELLLRAREERTGQAAAETEAFANMLSRLARMRLVWVIATLRSDLMSLLDVSSALNDLAQDDRLYRLERPRPGALSEIIRGPAELAGVRFVGQDKDDRPLVEVLTDAAKQQQDCLPLLEFTLKLLYDEDQGQTGQISYEQYERLGGLENAVGAWADKVVGVLGGNPETESAIDDVIFNLARRDRDTDVVVGAELVLDDGFLTPAREAVITALAHARLIVLDGDRDTPRRTARVAHVALLTHWPRARALFEKHAAKLALKDDVERDAIRWRGQERDPNFLMLTQVRVDAAKELLSDDHVVLSGIAREFIYESVSEHRRRTASVLERLARDEQKVTDLIGAGEYAKASEELGGIAAYLADETDPDLDERKTVIKNRRKRVQLLADYDSLAETALQKAGEEDFEQALRNCEAALGALKVLSDETWWNRLPIEDLSPDQIVLLRQNIYRTLMVDSLLQLAPGVRALFSARQSSVSPPPRIPSWAPGLILRVVPRASIAALARRGGLGRFRLPTRQDNAEAQVACNNCRAALRAVRRMEDTEGSQPLQARLLGERLVSAFSMLADGPKGDPIDFSGLLSSRAAAFAEPVNAADYFLIALFNFFIAKRASHGAAAAFLSLLKGNFPELDLRTPLATTERLLRVAAGLEPRNYWPHWLLGRTLLERENHGGAELSFNTAIALKPRYARGYEQRAVALARQWWVCRDEQLRERALRDSRLAGEVADGDPSIFWPRGELFDVLEQTADALNAWSFWLELEQDILSRIARSDGVKRLFDRTTAMLADSRARPLHAAAQTLLALVYWTWNDNEAALKAADAAIALDPRQPHALATKGAALLKLGYPERAIAEGLDPARAITPRNFFVLLNRAEAFEALNRTDDARAAWEELLAQATAEADDWCPPWIRAIAAERFTRRPQATAA